MRLMQLLCIALGVCFAQGARAESPPVSETEGQTQSASSPSTEVVDGGVSAMEIFDSGAAEDEEHVAETAGAGGVALPKADLVLVEIRDHLRALVASDLPDTIAVESLFTLPLDDRKAVSDRIVLIQDELGSLARNLAAIKERLKYPAAEIGEIPRPAELDITLVEPTPPTEPVEPEPPSFSRPRGKKTPRRSATWLERFEAWEKYEERVASVAVERTEYEKELALHAERLATYQTAVAKGKAATEQYNAALRQRNEQVARLTEELSRDAADTEVRVEIARYRLTYLTAHAENLAKLSDPAVATFAGLKSKRTAIRARHDSLVTVEQSLGKLLKRLRVLSLRTEAGSLIGFEVSRARLVQDVGAVTDAMERRRGALVRTAAELLASADEIEAKSTELRRLVFVQAANTKRDEVIDGVFLLHLKEMRLNAQRQGFTISSDRGDAEVEQLRQAIDEALASPEALGKVVEGEETLDRVKALVERLDSNLDGARIDLERFHQAFRREAVTILSGLASEATRRQAYSLSRELVADLIADLENLKTSLRGWAIEKKEELTNLPSRLSTTQGVILISRMVLAVLMVLALGLLGRQISRVVASAIRRFSSSGFFRHRIGSLVRWAGLVEALLPTIVFAAVGYAALALLGFEQPEVRFAEVAIRWIVIYALGRRFLEGLTRRVSRGRPAFISISPENAILLSKTYGRLGLFVALAAVAHEWADEWMGAGLLSALVLWSGWLWVAVWGLWAFFSWRVPLARSLSELGSEDRPVRRLGNWMEAHRVGAVTAPVALVWLVFDVVFSKLRAMLSEGGLFAYLHARSLRRMARTARHNPSSVPAVLPERYIKEFPLYPIYEEEDAVLLPRADLVASALGQLEKWKATRQDSSLVVVGEKGSGKTTFLTLLEKEIGSLAITRHSLTRKIRSEKALVEELGGVFDVPDAGHTGDLANKLKTGEERIVLLDESHNVFLRTVDGYEAYEALIRLVNFTSEKVFWVLVFNSFAWTFLNESRQRVHYFRRLLKLPAWSRDELLELISSRNKRSGVEIVFDEMLLDEARSVTGNFEVIDGAEGFFRLLWEASLGNPRVATRLWLDALTPLSDSSIKVGLFSEMAAGELAKMDRELLFTLAAVCQHENLSVGELRDVTNVSADFAGFAMRFLTEYDLLEPKHTDPRRLTLAPRYYPQVLKLLRQNHLLFEKE